jgi:cbb3-type cytochrome oxidase maturation protein
MSVLILLLIASLSVSILFLGAFIWSTKNKQFDDEYSSSIRILFDDQPKPADAEEEIKTPVININTYKRSENTSNQLN